MSRIRTIKPEFWTSEQVISCSHHARLLFIGLWNFCDDRGIHPASYIRLKAEIFPGDDCSIENIKAWVSELVIANLLHEYAIDDKRYWIITGWKQHQRIDKPTYRHPIPDSNSSSSSRNIVENYTTHQRLIDDISVNAHRDIVEASVTESNGMETNGREEDICEVAPTSRRVVSKKVYSAYTHEIFDYWKEKLNHSKAKLDKKRAGKIKIALGLGYSVEDLKLAVDGCAATPFNCGENDRNQRFDDIELILRDATHIESFITNASLPTITSGNSKSSTMLGVE